MVKTNETDSAGDYLDTRELWWATPQPYGTLKMEAETLILHVHSFLRCGI